LSTSSPNRALPALAGLAVVGLGVGFALALLWAPEDADQGISQRIFYLHVPAALTAYACFAWGAWKALRHLWLREERYDLESYTAVHMGVIFALLTLVTGTIWAKASWGVWWNWADEQLVLFLVLFLFYCAYFMLRFSVDRGPARARMSAVYALFGVVLVPVSFLAIRLAQPILHPPATVITRDVRDNIPAEMLVTFVVCFAGMLALAGALYAFELSGKRLDARLRELRANLTDERAGEPRARAVPVADREAVV
jgi:heme exporter protein C